MSKNHLVLKKMIYLVTLTAISIVLGLIEIPLGLPWLKLDLSEVVILLSVIVLGSKEAFIVILFRGFFRQFLQGDILIPHEVFGEVVAFVASSTLVLSYLLFAKILKRLNKPMLSECLVEQKPLNIKEYIVFILGMTLVLTVVMIGLNILFFTPIFLSLYNLIGWVNLERFHFSVFTILNDPGMTNVIGFDLSSLRNYLIYIISNYALLNVAKGILTSLIFLPAKERIEKIHLF